MELNETTIILFISMVAFLVSVITEVLKTWEWLDARIHTELLVIIVSLVMTPASYVALMCYLKRPIEWYMVFAAFIAAFIVALIAMDGWQRVTSIVDKCMKDRE